MLAPSTVGTGKQFKQVTFRHEPAESGDTSSGDHEAIAVPCAQLVEAELVGDLERRAPEAERLLAVSGLHEPAACFRQDLPLLAGGGKPLDKVERKPNRFGWGDAAIGAARSPA